MKNNKLKRIAKRFATDPVPVRIHKSKAEKNAKSKKPKRS